MDSTPALAIPLPELILRTGRQQGARKPLKAPITFVGSEAGCDIRLNIESVEPVHCVIAAGPEGPVVRAWHSADVFVNGSPVKVRTLCDGDRLRVGPFEFEIQIAAPLALPTDDELPSDSEGASLRASQQLFAIRDLHKQLREARAGFRRERKEQQQDISRRLSELAKARSALDEQQAEVERERSRLLQLRKRFIRRWKKHWSGERSRLERESGRLERERADLEARQTDFTRRNERLAAHAEAEQSRLEFGWQQLRDAERDAKEESSRQRQALDAQRRALVEDDRRLQTERVALRRERQQVEHHTAQLRIEASGLESRIVNLRAVLLQLETAHKPSEPAVIAPTDGQTASEPAVEQRLVDLERLIGDVADQRQALLEQTDRLAEAREAWRQEEKRLVWEMEQLAERLKAWEDRLIDREKDAAVDAESLERERTNLHQLRDRLEAWQARLNAREIELREETQRVEADLHQESRQLERREVAMTELCRRWSERRRVEMQRLRTEHRRCLKMRMECERKQAAGEQRERSLLQRQRDLAAQTLVLERARLKLLADVVDPRIAAKKLERLQRHVDRANAKHIELLDQRWQSLEAERKELAELFDRACKRIEESAALEREIADRLSEAERREQRMTEREIGLAENESVWKSQLESYERECGELRNEIDRLAGLLIEVGSVERPPLARAA